MGLENNQNKDKINEMMNNDGLTLSKAIEAVNQLKKIQGGQPMKILTKEEIRRLIEGEPNQ